MKSDEYVKKFLEAILRYQNSDDPKVKWAKDIDHVAMATLQCHHELILEIKEIAHKRNAISDTAIAAIAKEQIQKWKSIHRKLNLPTIREDGFRLTLLREVSCLAGFI